jgi:AcrR family transcriptional regulator
VAAELDRPLPRGPHRLSREDVVRSQRTRILAAITEAVAEKGYANTVVADVVGRSGVSRATFYELFTGKDDCFRAAYETHAALLTELMAVGLDELRRSAATPLEKHDGMLAAYLDALAAEPALARVFLVEVYAAGPECIEQRRRSQEAFVDVVAATHDGEGGLLGTAPDQRFAAEVLVAAVSSMVTALVAAGEVERLPELRVQLMDLARTLLAGR